MSSDLKLSRGMKLAKGWLNYNGRQQTAGRWSMADRLDGLLSEGTGVVV